MRRLLNIALIVIFVLSVAALFLAHEALYKIIYDLAVGALVTLAFYVLVVRIPDYERRQRIKRSLERRYREFREECIEIFLMVADGTYSADLPETLIDQHKFREYFMQKVTPDQTRWDQFLDNLDEKEGYLHELRAHMEVFRGELIFILNNIDIPKTEPFEFLKQLSAAISSMDHVTGGYDETKRLSLFLLDVFAGYGYVTGYRKEDIIKKMIDEI